MRNFFFLLLFLLSLGSAALVCAQAPDTPPASFDVIIKNNGEIIYGKVTEVNLMTIRYQRTDIPDGPVYEILKKDVYAISYRNQLTEYISPDTTFFVCRGEIVDVDEIAPEKEIAPEEEVALPDRHDPYEEFWESSVSQGNLHIGIGFIRNYSKVKEVSNYMSETSIPSIHISYMFPVQRNIEAGLSAGFASYNYSDKSYSEYDMLISDRDIRESLFSFGATGRYILNLNMIRPYISAGINFTNSKVNTEGIITFVDDNRAVIVQGGGRSGSLGIPLRVGADVRLTESFDAFMDFGTGLALLQFGGIIKIGM